MKNNVTFRELYIFSFKKNYIMRLCFLLYIYILRTPRVKTIFKKEIFLCQKVYSQNGNHNIGQIRVEQKFSLPRLQEDLC